MKFFFFLEAISANDLPHPSAAPEFTTFRTFLVYAPKCLSYHVMNPFAPNLTFHTFSPLCSNSFCIRKDLHLLSSSLTLILLMRRIGWAPNNIPIYIKQDATLHSLFIYWNCSTCFGWHLHPSSGAHTTVSTTASGICHAVTAICRYRGRVGTGLRVLWVAYVTHSTLKPVPTLPR
jgi:hypothetical protein